MERMTPLKASASGTGQDGFSSVPVDSKMTSTPLLPKPYLDHLKSCSSLSTKRQARGSRLTVARGEDEEEDEDEETRRWRRHNASASLHSSFLHHSSHPLSPIKSLPPQSRVFARPRIDRAAVVSFLPSCSSPTSSQPLKSASHQPSALPQSALPQPRPLRRQLSSLYDDKSKLEYLEQCFDVEGKIGEGSFGEVFKVLSKEDGKHYAVKRSRGAFRGTFDRKEKLGEVAKMEKMEPHPNIVQFYLAWEEKKHLYIQTELCMTSLQQFVAVEGVDDRLPEQRVWDVLLDLLNAVKHLHDSDLIHFDIKLDNIFVSRQDDGRYVCKLGDFGNARHENSGHLDDAQEGDAKYLAPEILGGVFSKAADVFSLGMTILEVATGLDPPCHGDGWHLLRGGNWDNDAILSPLLTPLSEDLRFLLNRMLEPNPQQRWTIDQILSSPQVRAVLRRDKWSRWWRKLVERVTRFFELLFFLVAALWERMVRQPFFIVTNSVFKVHLTPESLSASSSPIKNPSTPGTPCADARGSPPVRDEYSNASRLKLDCSPLIPIGTPNFASHRRLILRSHSSNSPSSPGVGFGLEDSFSDNDDAFEKHSAKKSNPSSPSAIAHSLGRSIASGSRQLMASFRSDAIIAGVGKVSPWSKLGLDMDGGDDPSGGKQNSSASSSILAAPLNDSLSPTSEHSSLAWDVHREEEEDATASCSLRGQERSATYEGATPSPKRQQRRPSMQRSGASLRLSSPKQPVQRPSQPLTTPSHLINESPLKPPLLMSTPRQRSMDLKNGASGAVGFEDASGRASHGPRSPVNDSFLRRGHGTSAASRHSPYRGRQSVVEDAASDISAVKGGDDDYVIGNIVSWEAQESMEDEEVASLVFPVVNDLSSGVGPKNLLSLFDSVSDEER